MKRSEVYDALKQWLESHGFDTGYQIQKRQWKDTKPADRFIVLQQNDGGASEQAVTRDYFRFLVITAQNDPSPDDVEDRADDIRQAMLDEHRTCAIILMKPIGGIPATPSAEGRIIFEINFQAIISR